MVFSLEAGRAGAILSALAIVLITACAPQVEPVANAPAGASCRVVRVVDGDTVEAICAGGPRERWRLVGFDTPEIFSPRCAAEQRLGLRAKAVLQQEVAGATLIVPRFGGVDRYGRRLVALSLDGEDVAATMIGAGLARRYSGGRRQGWCR